MHATIALLLFLAVPLLAQPASPRFLYIYRDSLKQGVDSTYSAIEDEAAQICADLKCPNPYLGLESLSGSREAWWINAFDNEADTARVVNAYARNRPLSQALEAIAKRKENLVGTPIKGFAFYRPDLSFGPPWSVVRARFIVVNVTRIRQPYGGSVWEMPDSTLYVLLPAVNREVAEALARERDARVFAVRASWSMPAPEWVAHDPDFWRLAPAPRPKR
jgi:hypothetical protein